GPSKQSWRHLVDAHVGTLRRQQHGDQQGERIVVVERDRRLLEALVEDRLDAVRLVLPFHCHHGYRVVVLDPTCGRFTEPIMSDSAFSEWFEALWTDREDRVYRSLF